MHQSRDVRCNGNKLHGVLQENNKFEVACSSRFCGASSETLVLHIIDLTSGDIVETKKYKKPHVRRSE